MELRSAIGHAVYMLSTFRVEHVGERPLTPGQRAVWTSALCSLRNDPTVYRINLLPTSEDVATGGDDEEYIKWQSRVCFGGER
jgi:hypothetical protein